jgi:hypothetical protein
LPQWAGKPDWKERATKWFDQMLTEQGLTKEDPRVRREWFGEWARETSTLVYSFDSNINILSTEVSKDRQYILGLDLGYHDATAFGIVSFSKDEPGCVVEHSEKHAKWSVSQVAERFKALHERYGPFRSVCDTGGLGKMIVEEMRRRYGVQLYAAKKSDKMAFIETMNSDLRLGLVKVRPSMPVIQEWQTLQRDEDGNEQQGQTNNCADAVLYAYREARHYRYSAPVTGLEQEAAWEARVWAPPKPKEDPDRWGEVTDAW